MTRRQRPAIADLDACRNSHGGHAGTRHGDRHAGDKKSFGDSGDRRDGHQGKGPTAPSSSGGLGSPAGSSTHERKDVGAQDQHLKTGGKVYLNGQIIDAATAKVSIFDYGFNYAGGVYDVVPCYDGKPLAMDPHLSRFQRSCKHIGFGLAHTNRELAEVVSRLLRVNEASPTGLSFVYLQATYGAYGGRSHLLPAAENLRPTLLVFTQPLKPFPPEYFTRGIALKSMPDERWHRCHIKSIALLPNVMDLNAVQKEGFTECVFVDAEGHVTEGSTCNVWCVKDGTAYTAPESNRILSGITRADVLRLARMNGIPVKEQVFTLPFLLTADEVFITSSTKEVCPVHQVDSTVYASSPGPTTMKLMKLYIDYVEAECGPDMLHWKRPLLTGLASTLAAQLNAAASTPAHPIPSRVSTGSAPGH
eukprot:tig00021435_g21390.t1